MSELLLCYNRGCGQKFDPSKNTEESCRHHCGYPVFHDAYKGWSCCKKKCTDFTEFLNIKGCTVSFHNNVKPPEPEKPVVDKSLADEVIEVKAPAPVVNKIKRPPFETPLVVLKPVVSPALRDVILNLSSNTKDCETNDEDKENSQNIPLGTTCKNNSCKVVYEGIQSTNETCTYHPGYPVFHEGLKFWTCCTKRTTDFETFLAQVGCTSGTHTWFKKKLKEGEVKCRMDWHQTGTFVYVSVFGKKCDPDSSLIEISPIRLKMSLYFPELNGAFSKDLELWGVVDVENSSVSMTPSKIEIKLRKQGPGTWTKLDIPRSDLIDQKPNPLSQEEEDSLENRVESVDLNFI
ncbi:cysteine and histidine-rich domain-containing protein morgana [Halyomorpha halys]|uniref:cysteine and histidine-rich domain-containing protein morgana n=1 Tax=Halyomorpha halys TaxID=286706 RepID=UPI0006D50A67|nr:cysteine and histidine-rich domain-containing protein [Halyomorpha halys]